VPTLHRTLFAAALVWAAAPVFAQQKPAGLPGNYPNKPIRVIVPASPGGGTDIVSRIVGQRLGERWGTAVVIENRGSAVGGVVGMDIAAKATPDGYTLLAVSASAVLNAALVNKTAVDQRVAFVPIVQLTTQPYLLAIPSSVPSQSVAEFVALAKAKPGALNYASAGNGSMSHLGGELFNSLAGVNLAHIPYKGTGPALTDLLGGQVQMLFAGGISVTPQIKSGRLRVLGQSALTRTRLLPNIPTIAESGLPGFELNGWYGWLAPTGTPPLYGMCVI
jgi:tripartite-type tricarboxylate transporter receptor subunit TctC